MKTSDIIDEIKEARWLGILGPKQAPSRWFSWHDAQAFYEPFAGERLAGLCLLGIQQGWFSKGSSQAGLLRALTPASKKDGPGDEKKLSTADAAERERRARDRCANSLHLVAAILANEDIQFEAKLASMVSQGQIDWHKKWSSSLNSDTAGAEFASLSAKGKLSTDVILTTAARCGDMDNLQRVGIEVDFSDASCKKLAHDSPFVLLQNDRMKLAIDLVWALISEEVRLMIAWSSLYPYRFAALLEASPDLLDAELRTMKETAEAWEEANKRTQPFWKRLVRRSPMAWVLNQDTFEIFRQEKYEYSARCKEQNERMWDHNMTTLQLERGFQHLRDHSRDQPSKQQCATALWLHPVRDGVLSQVHKFKEVSADKVPHNGNSGELLPPKFFEPHFNRSSFDFKDLPGKGVSSWMSMKAADIPVEGACIDFMRWCKVHGKMEEAPGAWKGCLATPGTLMRKVGVNQPLLWSLGAQGPLVYFWPAKAIRIGKTDYYEFAPGTEKTIHHEPILDLKAWKVVPTKVASPAAIFVANQHKPFAKMPGLACAHTGEPEMGLLEWVARTGFKKMNRAMLLRLDKAEVGAVDGETGMGEILLAMICKVLNCEAEEAAVILRGRCFGPDHMGMDEALQSEAAAEVMDTREKKECEQILNSKSDSDVQDEIAKTIRKVFAETKKPAVKKAKAKARPWPKEGVTVEVAQAHSPPGGRLYVDRTNDRFTMFLFEGSLSRSWRKYGINESLRLVVAWGWTTYSQFTGQPVMVEGLD